ncbi:MAG: sialidase family protein [Actinomycetota bacterium]
MKERLLTSAIAVAVTAASFVMSAPSSILSTTRPTAKIGPARTSGYPAASFVSSTGAVAKDAALPQPAPAHGLKFMPTTVVDPQNDLGEPSLRIDNKGNVYSCGPQGSTAAADRAQLSLDHGDTFRLLGEPPTGRIAPGGGGDCEIATAPEKNANGDYNLYYAGLEQLANFSASMSSDEGREFVGTSTSEAAPTVDRQWMAASGAQTNYLYYNETPGGGTVQRSDDGGLTYGLASAPGNAAPDIDRPGPIVIDDNPDHNPDGNKNETLYGVYTAGNSVKLFRSTDRGQTFTQTVVSTTEGNPSSLFAVLDIDTKGNLYAAWAEKQSYDVFYSYSTDQGKTWSKKQLVNRAGASSNLMPWIVAGDPGRIAIAFYCSSVDGSPEDAAFQAPWYVCVNQSSNALSTHATFSQVRATSHPNHWGQICTGGIGCTTGGDRTLYDFITARLDPTTGRLFVVFTQSNKVSGAAAGGPSIDVIVKQKSGPSLLKSFGTAAKDKRKNVRSAAVDPKGDALFDFSSFGPPAASRTNQPGLDIKSVRLSRSHMKVSGKSVLALKATMKVADLSDSALTSALSNMQASDLMFVVRWFSGFQPDYMTADWNPATGFTFGHGHLVTAQGPFTEIYPAPGDGAIPGKVNADKGTITMKFPYSEIQRYRIKDPTKVVKEKPAIPGTHIWEVTAFTFGRPNAADQGANDLYNQGDSTPSFDYMLKQ